MTSSARKHQALSPGFQVKSKYKPFARTLKKRQLTYGEAKGFEGI
jgi:hypothetical protein